MGLGQRLNNLLNCVRWSSRVHSYLLILFWITLIMVIKLLTKTET